MKCPHCNHVADESVLLKCSRCHQVYERAPFEEYQHLKYLAEWLAERQDRLGEPAMIMLAEVSARLSAIQEILGVEERSVEEVARELELNKAILTLLPQWKAGASIGDSVTADLSAHLHSQVERLGKELPIPGTDGAKASTIAALDFALDSLPLWQLGTELTAADAEQLRTFLAGQREAAIRDLTARLVLADKLITLLPAWGQKNLVDAGAVASLQTTFGTWADERKESIPESVPVAEYAAELDVIDFIDRSESQWIESGMVQAGQFDVEKLHEYRAAIIHQLSDELSLKSAVLQRIQRIDLKKAHKPGLVHDLEARVNLLQRELGGHASLLPKTTDRRVIDFLLESLPSWVEKGYVDPKDASRLQPYLEKLRIPLKEAVAESMPASPAVAGEATAAESLPARADVITAKREPINWGRLRDMAVESVTSGALLRGLLFLGAFMIVISATVLVVRFWNNFPQFLQLAFIAAVPTSFYLAGWGVRARMKLPQAGTVLSGIGALLVAVDFAAVFQFGGLQEMVSSSLYLLIASAVCTVVYGVTAWRLQGEFFHYITLLAGTSVVVAITRLLGLRLEWSIASITAAGTAMLLGASKAWDAPGNWHGFARAARYLPQILLPVTMAVVLFVPGEPAAGQISVFGLAALGYGVLAWRFPATLFAHSAVWSSLAALAFAIWHSAIPYEWYGASAALLAIPYLLAGKWLEGRLMAAFKPRRGYLLAVLGAGFILVGLGLLGGAVALLAELWAAVAAFTLVSFVLVGAAMLFQRPGLMAAGSVLAVLPFSLAIGQILLDFEIAQQAVWLGAAWCGLALSYLGLAAVLSRFEKYVRWLNLWAHLLALAAAVGVSISGIYTGAPTLVAVGGIFLVYLLSAVLHDSRRHPALSQPIARLLPDPFDRSAFLWPAGLVLVAWGLIAWASAGLSMEWIGVLTAGFGLAYFGLGERLHRRVRAYRLPFHTFTYLLSAAGIGLSLSNRLPLTSALSLSVLSIAGLAWTYRRIPEVALATGLLIWPFQLTLELANLTPHSWSLAYAILASLVYLPLGLKVREVDRQLGIPPLVFSFGTAALAVITSLLGRFAAYPLDLKWIGVLVPLVVTGLLVFSAYRFGTWAFAWVSVPVLAIAYGQGLTLINLPAPYDAAAWVLLGGVFLALDRLLKRTAAESWMRLYRIPFLVSPILFGALGFLLTAGPTLAAFTGRGVADYVPPLLAQLMAVLLTILLAWAYRNRWPLYVEPWLAFFPITLFFIGYGEKLFGASLIVAEFGLVWSVSGLVHLLAAFYFDNRERSQKADERARYAQGLHLGGYGLPLLGLVWTMGNPVLFLWTFAVWILIMFESAVLAHHGRHLTWEALTTAIFARLGETGLATVRSAFWWLGAWLTPIWLVLFLDQLGVLPGYQWLGLAMASLVYLAIAQWLGSLNQAYAWPFTAAGQFYTALGLLISAPFTLRKLVGPAISYGGQTNPLALVLIQAAAVLFYALSARIHRMRRLHSMFPYLAAGLTFFPYTLSWIQFGPRVLGRSIPSAQFALLWSGLAIALLAIAAWRDQRDHRPVVQTTDSQARRPAFKYAQGPYVVGYALAGFALLWSFPDRLANIYTLGAFILVAIGSHLLAHGGRHHTFSSAVEVLFRKSEAPAHQAARALFLFTAAYGFPIWLAQLLTYLEVPLAWRGAALALTAPLYIASGLAARQVRAAYSWPFFSAGYALTAIGAMVSFENLVLATYVLALNTLVYAASAYIYRKSYWLYLSNVLVPVVVLLALQNNERLVAPWVAGGFMALAFLYFIVGQVFDRRLPARDSAGTNISPFALPFYAPGYLLSAAALGVASSERTLAIVAFSAGVVLYAISAWRFHETLFIYPAAWLAAVPYYLGMTALSLPAIWYGLGWLPLILLWIGLGRLAFRKVPFKLQPLGAALTHPAAPFYLLAYGLSVSMLVLSLGDPLTLTLAFAAAAVLYLGSAGLFRHAGWLYPGLLAGHIALMSALTIRPSGSPSHYLTLPMHALTWAMALAGLWFSRRFPASTATQLGDRVFRFARWEINFGRLASLGHLVTPSWAQPFFLFFALDLIVWQALAFYGFDTAIILAVGHALVLGLLATRWQDPLTAYGALGFLLLGAGFRLGWVPYDFPVALAWFSAFGLGYYLYARGIARLVSIRERSRLGLWVQALTHTGIILSIVGFLGSLPALSTSFVPTAAALASSGALYLAIAYRGRYHRLGYLGMAMLEIAWVMALVARDIAQPQWYAIPAGLYFITVGYLERRRSRPLFANLVESFGLAVLLVPSFIQSLNGNAGFPYFLLLLVEGLLVTVWASTQHLKIPFFVGLGASVLNVVAQVIVLVSVYQISRWYIIGGVGLLLVATAIYVERHRENISSQARLFLGTVDRWQ